jgi:NADPH:quinone reductase-like Zn-dependent oxidoreductase
MKAVVMHEHGGPEVLRYEDVPDPIAGPGEALVRVRACALNHLDIWTRIGQAGRMVTFPHILGNDIAGEVVSLRTPVEGIAPGERVIVSPGTSCGRCRLCLSVFLTAWRMLVTRAHVRIGEDVLVWAAGSGVGMAAIQVAKLHGARVIATAGSAAKLEQARKIGADAVIDHHKQDVVAEVERLTSRKGADIVVEHVGAATWERSILSLAHRGRLVTCGATTGATGATELRHLFAKQLSLLGSYMGGKAELLEAAAFYFAHKLTPVVHTVLPLAEARSAHEMMEKSEHFGKIVLQVA